MPRTAKKTNWWENCSSIKELVAIKNELYIKELSEKKASLRELHKEGIIDEKELAQKLRALNITKDDYQWSKFVVKNSVNPDMLSSAEKGNVEVTETIVKNLIDALECPKEVIHKILNFKNGDTMSEEKSKKRRGRPPGSKNKKAHSTPETTEEIKTVTNVAETPKRRGRPSKNENNTNGNGEEKTYTISESEKKLLDWAKKGVKLFKSLS
jgi:hypothetical protein